VSFGFARGVGRPLDRGCSLQQQVGDVETGFLEERPILVGLVELQGRLRLIVRGLMVGIRYGRPIPLISRALGANRAYRTRTRYARSRAELGL